MEGLRVSLIMNARTAYAIRLDQSKEVSQSSRLQPRTCCGDDTAQNGDTNRNYGFIPLLPLCNSSASAARPITLARTSLESDSKFSLALRSLTPNHR